MQVLFHIGLNKCGSTYLQNVLRKNSRRLSQSSICYPNPSFDAGNAERLNNCLDREDKEKTKEELKRLINECEGADVVILSNESIYHRIVEKTKRDILNDAFKELNVIDVLYIVIYRNIYRHAVSAYAHRAGIHDLPDFGRWVGAKNGRLVIKNKRRFIDAYEFWDDTEKMIKSTVEPNWRVVEHSYDMVNEFSRILNFQLDESRCDDANVSVNIAESEVLRRIRAIEPKAALVYRDESKKLHKNEKADVGHLLESYYDDISKAISSNKKTVQRLEEIIGFDISKRPAITKYINCHTSRSAICLSASQIDILISTIVKTSSIHYRIYSVAMRVSNKITSIFKRVFFSF
jgi:hypothetical protein